MAEKDKRTKGEREELSLAERNTKMREERLAKRNARIEERNRIIAARSEEILKKNGGYAPRQNSEPNDKPYSSTTESESCAEAQEALIVKPASESHQGAKEPTGTDNEPKSGKRKKENIFAILSLIVSAVELWLIAVVIICGLPGITPLTTHEVVYINVADKNTGTDVSDNENYSSNSDMLEAAMDTVVIVHTQLSEGTSTGSGVVISENGYIITNFHVVSGAVKVQVEFRNTKKFVDATVIGYKTHDDIAVIKVDMTGLDAATIGNSSLCHTGDRVYAIGCPQGADYAWTVTQGIISSPMRDLKIYNTSTGVLDKKMKVIQTDTPVNPGNSGGPLINADGQVIGVITMKLTDSSGMGFALPSDAVMAMVEGIIEKGGGENVKSTIATGRPVIGISGIAVKEKTYYNIAGSQIKETTATHAAKNPDTTFYSPANGIYVNSVNKGTDAEKKLQKGDIITSVNGIDVASVNDVSLIINDLYGGSIVDVVFYRDGETHTVQINLGEEELE